MSNQMSLMSPQLPNEMLLGIAEEWLEECYDEEGERIEPIYLYINKCLAQVLYGLTDLHVRFEVTELSSEMVKLVKREETIAH